MSKVIEIKNPQDFQTQVLAASVPVLVDFWAEWCGPCKMLSPVLDEVAEALAGQVLVAKVNVDENNELAAEFRIRSIPNLFVIRGGEVKEQHTGFASKNELMALLQKHI